VIVQPIGGTKRKVHLSFDVEQGQPYKDFFVRQGQKRDATWSVTSTSPAFGLNDPRWLSTLTSLIKRAEALLVLLTPTTYRSLSVLKEVTIAQILGRPVFQIIPYGAGEPHVIPNAGRAIAWD
jgi:hypothetical protein